MAANLGTVLFPPTAMDLHNRGALLTFGSLQLIFAVGLIINDAIAFVTTYIDYAVVYTAAGSGFYLGIYYIITGSLGIAAGARLLPGTPPTSRKCLLVTTMVMSILATIFSFIVFIVFAVLLAQFSSGYALLLDRDCSISSPTPSWSSWCHFFYWQKGYGHLGSNMLFELIVFITSLGSCIAAGVNYCKLPSKITNGQVVYMQSGQTGYYPGGQQVMYDQTMPGQQVYFMPPQQTPLAAPPGYSETAQPAESPEGTPAAQN